MNFLKKSLFAASALLVLSLAACAGLRDDAPEGSAGGGDSGMADAPCTECGKRGDIELKITDEKIYQEWNQVAYTRIDSGAVVGVFPALKVTAKRPENCKICHSYSADALDFDLARIEDSLFTAAFPKMQRELMLPGMRLPDEDSSYVDTMAVNFLMSVFADGKKLENFGPWQERDGISQAYQREVPAKLKTLLENVASRYGIRYASIPVSLEVEMFPKMGKSGGYTWKILWTLWDARYGELVFLTYSEFTAATTSRVAPEKEWATPFAARLSKMFQVDFSKLESH